MRPGASSGAFTLLAGRQHLTPVPNAIYSSTAPWAGLQGVPAGFADGVDADSGGDITAVTTAVGSGLQDGADTGPVALSLIRTCGTGQVLRWSGSAWVCASSLPPSGTAGGSLSGAYPNPGIAAAAVGTAQISAAGSSDGQALVSNGVSVSWATAAVPARKFYLSQTPVTGSQPTTACAAGYHMASLWEIHNTTVLSYDAVLGFVTADSGGGPPSGVYGWMRTGGASLATGLAGRTNCSAWTSGLDTSSGTLASLTEDWYQIGHPADVNVGARIDPWQAATNACNNPWPVWCVQN